MNEIYPALNERIADALTDGFNFSESILKELSAIINRVIEDYSKEGLPFTKALAEIEQPEPGELVKKYTEKEILLSYEGRCICDKQELGGGYCGSCSIKVHRKQLNDPKSWVHSSVKRWLEAVNPKPTYEQLQVEIDRLEAENKQQAERIKKLKTFAKDIIMEYCWNLGDPDGGSIQDLAENLGLIEPKIATAEDVSEYSDFEEGDTIYKFTDLLSRP